MPPRSMFSSPLAVAATAVVATATWHLGGKLLRRQLNRKLTVVDELPYVTESRPSKIKGTAVVCGGRLLANHFEHVLIIEAEAWVDSALGVLPIYDKNGNVIDESRKHSRARVWQYDHVHTFWPLVNRTVNKLFPGFNDRVIDADGRIKSDAINMYCRDGRVFRKSEDFIFGSRELFERLLRCEVLQYPGIKHIVGTAIGITLEDGDCTRINGVTVRSEDNTETHFSAVFVADCTGAAQAGLKWLKRIDKEFSPAPQIRDYVPFDSLREEYTIAQRNRRYRFFVPPEARQRLPIPGGYDNAGWVYAYLPVPGVDNRSCIINRIEGHRLEVILGCRKGIEVPETFEDIIPFLKNMSTTYKAPEWVIEMFSILIKYKDQCEELTTTSALPFSRVLYEKAPFIPSNFVPIGDSCMRVNPVYGQGVSKSCMSAVMLNGLLRKERGTIPDGFGRRYVEMHAQKTAGIWHGNITIDYQWPSTIPVAGKKRSDIDGMAKFTDLVMRCAIKDDKVDRTMTDVRGFIAPPTDMFHPMILIKLFGLWLEMKFSSSSS